MSLDSVAEQLAGADPQLAQFLQAETQKQRFQVSWLIDTCILFYYFITHNINQLIFPGSSSQPN